MQGVGVYRTCIQLWYLWSLSLKAQYPVSVIFWRHCHHVDVFNRTRDNKFSEENSGTISLIQLNAIQHLYWVDHRTLFVFSCIHADCFVCKYICAIINLSHYTVHWLSNYYIAIASSRVWSSKFEFLGGNVYTAHYIVNECQIWPPHCLCIPNH